MFEIIIGITVVLVALVLIACLLFVFGSLIGIPIYIVLKWNEEIENE